MRTTISTNMSGGRTPTAAQPAHRPSPLLRRFLGVVTQPRSYRSIAYLLLGLPLGTIWFSVLVSALSVGISLLAVALLGIPVLLGTWYAVRAFANIERHLADALLDRPLAPAPIASTHRGNPWVRLRAMGSDTLRRRELAYLLLRFPAGIATFTITATALATPILIALAPIQARHAVHPFGKWALSSTMEQAASNTPWSWLLVPAGLAMLIPALHLINALANVCGQATSNWLNADNP